MSSALSEYYFVNMKESIDIVDINLYAISVHKALTLTLYTTIKITAINKAEFNTSTPNINGRG